MSDEILGSLTEMAEKQAAERLGQSEVGEMAEKFGLGNADELVGKAAGLFGLQSHAPAHEALEAADSESEAPQQENESTEDAPAESQGDEDNQ